MAKVVEQLAIEFTEEELNKFGINEGDPFSAYVEDGRIVLVPYGKVELELDELSRECLELLVLKSCEDNIPVSEVIENILSDFLD